MRDGFPVYGYCQNSSGTQLKSCYALSSGGDASVWSGYYYDSTSYANGKCMVDDFQGFEKREMESKPREIGIVFHRFVSVTQVIHF